MPHGTPEGRKAWMKTPKGRAYSARARKARYDRFRERINGIKLAAGCMDCGYNAHPAALDFDHRDPSTKKSNVTYLLASTWRVIQEEIDKCDIRCANCHRVKTHSGGESDSTQSEAI